MDWTHTFYAFQERLCGVYTQDIQPYHRTKADLVALSPPQSILELGAGGGQVSAVLASRGHSVTAIDLNPLAVQHATSLANSINPPGSLQAIGGDFYTLELPDSSFDALCYWDGFGIGSDDDQRTLLRRAAQWARPHATFWIDIYTPWYWSACAGKESTFPGDVHRRYGYDTNGARMLDTWWSGSDPETTSTQSLRCYSPADLDLLLEATPWTCIDHLPGCGTDATGTFLERAPMHQAMMYTAVCKLRE